MKENKLLEQISPQILRCTFFSGLNLPIGTERPRRTVIDYEMTYILDGNGFTKVDGEIYPVTKGNILFRTPGQHVQGIMPYSCIQICFDMQDNPYNRFIHFNKKTPKRRQEKFPNPQVEKIPSVFTPQDFEKYSFLFESVYDLFIEGSDCSFMLIKSLILQILYNIITEILPPVALHNIPPSAYHKKLQKIVNYINKNYHEKIRLNDLAVLANLSPSHLHKLFTKTLMITPNDYIQKLRIQIAKEQLVKTNKPISDIAEQCGFLNAPYFSYVFHQQIGISPSKFRQTHSYF